MVTIAIGSALDTVSTHIESIQILWQKLQARNEILGSLHLL